MEVYIPQRRKENDVSRKSMSDVTRSGPALSPAPSFANSSSQTIAAFPSGASATTSLSPSVSAVSGSDAVGAPSVLPVTASSPTQNSTYPKDLNQTTSSGLSAAAIAVIVVVIIILLGGVIIFILLRRRRLQKQAASSVSEKQIRTDSMRSCSIPKSTRASFVAAGSAITSDKCRVVYMLYKPTQEDEMKVDVGDQIQVVEEYDDGWCLGFNLTSGQDGVLPQECLKDPQASTV